VGACSIKANVELKFPRAACNTLKQTRTVGRAMRALQLSQRGKVRKKHDMKK
jgi:hypothetical protein